MSSTVVASKPRSVNSRIATRSMSSREDTGGRGSTSLWTGMGPCGHNWHPTTGGGHGLEAPICLTWELTYGCNLACVHCLSSSGRRDPRELTTSELFGVVDELAAMQVFYVNIGGGEPTLRPDFWELLDYCVANKVGVKFS